MDFYLWRGFSPSDLAALVEAFGIRGEKAASIEGSQAALQRALEQRHPTLLEVQVDFREYYDLL